MNIRFSKPKFRVIAFLAFAFTIECDRDDAANSKSQNLPSEGNERTRLLKLNKDDVHVVPLTQIVRPEYHDQYEVPIYPSFEDRFYQAEETVMKLDILIVIDNSGSMAEEQNNLSNKLEALLSQIHDLSWQIGVITTEWPCFLSTSLPFTPETAGLTSKFRTSIRQGTSGSGYEVGMWMSQVNLLKEEFLQRDYNSPYYGRRCTPSSWLRSDAKLAVLFVSDEDEDASSRTTPEEYVEALKTLGYQPKKTARTYGIISRPGFPCATADFPAYKLNQLVQMTGGITGDICAMDYTQTLESISANFRDMILEKYPLRGIPVLSTLKITINGAPYIGAFNLIDNKLTLPNPLNRGDTMIVEYKIDEARLVSLAQSVDPSSIKITINGQALNKNAFSYRSKTRSVHFNEAVGEGQVIDVYSRADMKLMTEYDFPRLNENQKIECYLGDEFVDFEYDAKNGKIRLLNPHPDGETVYCLYL